LSFSRNVTSFGTSLCAVGYKNDFVVDTVTASNATQVSRFGD
jgi:hypothetical protein